MKRHTQSFITYIQKFFTRWAHVLYALITASCALFLMVSLLSYNRLDQSWCIHHAQPGPCHNLAGLWGAQCAALCFYLFGITAYILAPILVWYAWLTYSRLWGWQTIDRLSASIALLCAGAAVCHHFKVGKPAGGLLGYATYTKLAALSDPAIATIIVCVVLACALIVLFPLTTWRIVCACKRLCIFLYRNPEIFVSAAHSIAYAFWLLAQPFVRFARYIVALIDGSWLPADESIVDFEQAHTQHDQATSSDDFWLHYLQERVDSDAKERTTPATRIVTPPDAPKVSAPASPEPTRSFSLPHGDLLKSATPKTTPEKSYAHEHEQDARTLEEKLRHFGISGTVTSIKQGPVVTVFEYKPEIDARISKIIALEDDLALALQALSIRIIAPIPGKAVIGIEVPNKTRQTVALFDIMQKNNFKHGSGALRIALGVDTVGNDIIVDLTRMPHLLVAGSTGSGKSVALHTMLISLLCTHTPESMRLVLIDPKRLEFAPYADIAHLLFPIINTPAHALPALGWVVREMEKRYECMTEAGVRTIAEYNAMAHKEGLETLPFIVVCIDELADLMMLAGKESEDLITRIAQMARAAGIHMIVATQRPSVDVITGLIKVNFPSRISFRISTKIDSRTIIDCCGAEKLLGNGDMLFLDSTDSLIKRIQGAFIAHTDIERIIQFIKSQRAPAYESYNDVQKDISGSPDAADEELFQSVLTFIQQLDEISISLLQRRFRIGYNRSARMIDILEARGFISPADGQKLRKVIRH